MWNRCYEPFAIERDTTLKSALAKQGIAVQGFNAALLHEPWDDENRQPASHSGSSRRSGRHCAEREVGKPHPAPRTSSLSNKLQGDGLEDWKLLPLKPDWAKGFDWQSWRSSRAARIAL